MKVLITGASGLLGRAIKREFDKNTSWEILGLGYSRLQGGLKKVDLKNENEVIATIDEFQPDVVIHSAAERRPDFVVNKVTETEQLNITATETIAKCVNKYGGFMMYISTDYVFDGTNPPYKSNDAPNPLNKYGETKLIGEQRTISLCEKSGVLRVPILYGNISYVEESAVTGLFPLLQDNTKISSVSNYEQRYPTSTRDIAVVCRQIIEYRQNNPTFCGIWQWRSNDKLTKYGMIEIMSKVFNKSMDHITPNSAATGGATRPYDCEFDCSELENIGISQRTSFIEEIEECLKPFI